MKSVLRSFAIPLVQALVVLMFWFATAERLSA